MNVILCRLQWQLCYPPSCINFQKQTSRKSQSASSSSAGNNSIHEWVSVLINRNLTQNWEGYTGCFQVFCFLTCVNIHRSLASFNLPAALEDLSTESQTVPPSVLHKADKVRSAGGATRISQQMTDISGLLRKCESILAQVWYLIWLVTDIQIYPPLIIGSTSIYRFFKF